uniref:transporter n=2 Tax=Flavobacterium sp. TaxID=239 RepID=UPI00404B935C
MKNFVLTLCLVLISTHSYCQYTDVINSNRPGESQTAYAVGRNVFQAEFGLYGIREKHDQSRYTAHGFGSNIAFRFGYFKEQLEFLTEIDYKVAYFRAPLNSANRSGLRSITLGAKYLFFDPYNNFQDDEEIDLYSWRNNNRFKWSNLIPAISVYAGANINYRNPYNFPDDTALSPKIMVIMQSNVIQDWVLVGNIILDKFTTKSPSYGGILTVTRGINPRLTSFLELKAIKSDYYADGILTGGAAWLVSDKIQLDASLSKNIKNTPSLFYGGVGFSWRFDDYYEPVIVSYETEKEKEIKEKIKDKSGKVEQIGGPEKDPEGGQDVDPEGIKEDVNEAQPEEGGRRKRRSRRNKETDTDLNEVDTKRVRRDEKAPPVEVPEVIDIKNIKRE